MENYEKIMLDKGREKLDYEEIAEYYGEIINRIYTEIEKESPSQYNTEKQNISYSDEYLDAYSYLQKAEWRISDIRQLKDYEKDEDYKYFATEHLSDVRHRIESYLEKTTMKFTSPVYDYKKYDRILEERKELRKNSKYTAGLKKWQKTCYIDAEVKHIELYINNIKDYTQALKQAVTSSTINYIETENLLETIKLLEKVEKDLEITIKER